MIRTLILTALLTSLINPSTAGSGHASRRNNPLGLIGDDGRKRLRPHECHFGKTIRELGATWFADLGPPFGVMYCIKCECVPVQKKRRIVAKVQCRNIKRECPVPSCDEPVLLPGQCCKLCPEDLNGSNIMHEMPAVEEDKSMKYFGTLLTPRTSLTFKRDDIVNIPSTSEVPAFQIIATGRFTFHRKNLYYSFYLINALGAVPLRPRSIQFINCKGDILEEHNLLTGSVYQNATGKVCGVWRRLPREYKKLLRDEELCIALLWGNNLALSGRIARFKALNSEHYTALLSPPSSPLIKPDGGGTAIISVSTLAAANVLHIALVFNGLFTPSDVADVPLKFRLENEDRVLYEDTVQVGKPSASLNQVEIQFSLAANEFRLLGRGKVYISLSSTSKPDLLNLKGPILSKATCEIFQTPLLPNTGFGESGLLWMFTNRDGALVYNWELSQAKDMAALNLFPNRGGKNVQTLNITSGYKGSQSFEKLPPKTLVMLYGEDVTVEMLSRQGDQRLQGALLSRPVAGALEAPAPVLLLRPPNIESRITGLAWMTVDLDCDLHYEVHIMGGESYKGFQLYLEETPMIAPNAPVTRRKLEEFNGTFLESFAQLTPQEASRIDYGVSFLEVLDLSTNLLLLRANMKPVQIPSECLTSTSDNDVPSYPQTSNNLMIIDVAKCFHEGRFYDEGVQWRHARDPCRMCYCSRGRYQCDDVICPALHCIHKVTPMKDQCCSSCSNGSLAAENTAVGCLLGGQFYPAGSSWHPYVPPHGFDLCTIMSCDLNSLSLRYTRVRCPPLKCAEKDQIRTSPNSCCKQCAPTEELPHDQELMPPRPRTAEEVMRSGGCNWFNQLYENKAEWAHTIPSVGLIPCLKCHCKDGKVSCGRKQCPRLQCNSANNTLQPLDECCSSQCRRYRRQSRNHHRKS